ncbi:MAG: MMPL family transporter [Dehalococcoidia bacterium]|nr:MMPL family transporter [Dehalococcoidia bacterium]
MQENPKTSLLDRLGRFAVRNRWYVVGAWVLAIGIGVPVALLTARGTVSTLEIPGAESQDAVDVLSQAFPERSGDYGDIVIASDAGLAEGANRAAVENLVADVSSLPGVAAVASPYAEVGGLLSPDSTVAIVRVQFVDSADSVDGKLIDAVEGAMAELRSTDVQVEFGGPVAAAQEQEGPSESTLLALVAALVVLYILFRAIVPTVLPIGTAIVGLIGGFGAVMALTSAVELSRFAPTIAAMLGIGVGIDYALFIVARHRQNLGRGMSVYDSVGSAMGTAGNAVLFAGAVVITALLGLLLMGIPFVGWIGVASAIMVGLAVLVALTLLPALLGIVGTAAGAKRTEAPVEDEHDASGWLHLGYTIMRRPYLYFILTSILLLVLAIPVLDIRLGAADAGSNPESSTTRRAYDLTAEAFGEGMNGPLQVVVEDVSETTLSRLPEAISQDPGVASVGMPMVNRDGDVAVFAVTPRTDPQSAETTDLVHRLRNEVVPAVVEDSPATVYIAGSTARHIDIADRIADRLPIFFAIVIGVSFILLTAVFRSVVIAGKAALMNILSIGAAYGVVVAVFQWGWGLGLTGATGTGPIESFLPMMLFAVLFGLSMDYEVFLVSRIHEEYLRTGDNAVSVARGLASTASVITAAAAIMIVVFLSFVLNDQRVVKEFGLGLAIAVFIDATVVRLMLVPATMELMGKWNWWLPSWMGRLIPHISLEGEGPAHSGAAK